MADKEKLTAILNMINKNIKKDDDVDIYTLFEIKRIINDEKDNEKMYDKYIKPYI